MCDICEDENYCRFCMTREGMSYLARNCEDGEMTGCSYCYRKYEVQFFYNKEGKKVNGILVPVGVDEEIEDYDAPVDYSKDGYNCPVRRYYAKKE